MISPKGAYAGLLSAYGPRGWWPTTAAGSSRPRYHPGRRRPPTAAEAFEICVGAVLTQNTAWTNVERALETLHADGALTPERLAAMPEARLAGLIKSSGYFRQKARKLKTLARWAESLPALRRRLRRTELAALRAELLSLWGVGPETADSILLYAGGRAAFVVDAYTRRIGARLGWYPEKTGYDGARDFLTSRMEASVPVYQEMHALLVELAKRSCKKRPVCLRCPLKRGCPSSRRTS